MREFLSLAIGFQRDEQSVDDSLLVTLPVGVKFYLAGSFPASEADRKTGLNEPIWAGLFSDPKMGLPHCEKGGFLIEFESLKRTAAKRQK